MMSPRGDKIRNEYKQKIQEVRIRWFESLKQSGGDYIVKRVRDLEDQEETRKIKTEVE